MIENSNSGMDSKTMGIVTYLTLIGWIVALILNQTPKYPNVSFHLRQMLGIFLTGLLFSFISIIPILGWLISWLGWLFVLVLWIIAFVGALNNEQKLVPVLGEKYQEIFSGIN